NDKHLNLLLAHNREHYAGFSYVENIPPDEDPLVHYETGSIDCLLLGPELNSPHEAWLECLAPGGIALLMGVSRSQLREHGYILNLGQQITLYFNARNSVGSDTILAALREDGVESVECLYRHMGEHLRMHREIGGGLFSDTHRRN